MILDEEEEQVKRKKEGKWIIPFREEEGIEEEKEHGGRKERKGKRKNIWKVTKGYTNKDMEEKGKKRMGRRDKRKKIYKSDVTQYKRGLRNKE